MKLFNESNKQSSYIFSCNFCLQLRTKEIDTAVLSFVFNFRCKTFLTGYRCIPNITLCFCIIKGTIFLFNYLKLTNIIKLISVTLLYVYGSQKLIILSLFFLFKKNKQPDLGKSNSHINRKQNHCPCVLTRAFFKLQKIYQNIYIIFKFVSTIGKSCPREC